MSNFEIVEWYTDGRQCKVYTIHVLTKQDNEASLFFGKYGSTLSPLHNQALQLLQFIVKSICNKHGAIDDFFDRHENLVNALPPLPKKQPIEIAILGSAFPLRLYCIRVNEQIVILFNGGEKTSNTAQDSKDLSLKFYEAQSFAIKIQDALRSFIIELDGTKRNLRHYQIGNKMIL